MTLKTLLKPGARKCISLLRRYARRCLRGAVAAPVVVVWISFEQQIALPTMLVRDVAAITLCCLAAAFFLYVYIGWLERGLQES